MEEESLCLVGLFIVKRGILTSGTDFGCGFLSFKKCVIFWTWLDTCSV